MINGNSSSFIVIVPVFNDWEALRLLLSTLEDQLTGKNLDVTILIVDDGSTTVAPDFDVRNQTALKGISVLTLRRNLGHQRAITIGLAHVESHSSCRAVVIMDADGQDKASDVLRLINESKIQEDDRVIFAKRVKRSESIVFRISYKLYRQLFYGLTGQEISVGNFSLIPFSLLRRLVVVSEIWNHYSSGIMKAKVPYSFLKCERGDRLSGKSTMNYVSLVTHGLSAISVFGDVIGVRALIGTVLLAIISLVLIIVAVIVRSLTDLAIPGWTSYVVGLAFIILLQSITLSFAFVFLVLNGRNSLTFLPQRDYQAFISDIRQIYPQGNHRSEGIQPVVLAVVDDTPGALLNSVSQRHG